MIKLKFVYITLFIALFIFGGFFIGNKKAEKTNLILNPTPLISTGNNNLFKVTRVVDGDTIKVVINNKEESVRLIGIDAPETVDPRKPVQCFGNEASDRAKLILTNQLVRLESDVTQGNRDKYGRLLRFVFLQDGTNFNKLMVSEGYAH